MKDLHCVTFASISAEGPFTVFAPNNAAFQKLPPGKLSDLLSNETALVCKYKACQMQTSYNVFTMGFRLIYQFTFQHFVLRCISHFTLCNFFFKGKDKPTILFIYNC